MTRERLPNRRHSETNSIRWPPHNSRRLHIGAGYSPDGRLLETFIDGGARDGSEMAFLLGDCAVLISRLLQFGDRLPDIAASIGRTSDKAPASVIGAIADALCQMERR